MPAYASRNQNHKGMLQLQRASAGSGKTYTLAKKFIWFLIAVKTGSGHWRLRSAAEIADGLPRILAITFTNKATNEMKQRIVEKLADLSRADGSAPLSPAEISGIAYLKDFAADLGAGTTDVGKACRTALSVLLNEYSDLKVSTIDSFFQTILRTFAYESNLNDTYQVEIDSDFIATAAVDSTLDDINSLRGESIASFWMKELIREEADAGKTSWNIFQKSEHRDSLYTRLRQSIKRLENEDFKEIRSLLDDYFDTPDGSDPLIKGYVECRDKIERPLRESLLAARKEADSLIRLFRQQGLDIAADGHRYLKGHLEKLRRLRFNQTVKTDIFSPLRPGVKDSILKKGTQCADPDSLTQCAARMYEAYSTWLDLRDRAEWRHWALYAPHIPYLGLIGEARRKMHEFLDNNNTIQLGETNSMLRRIIGKDDAPFIYERLGTSINHYLIDEFQDTSRLQWDNLYPLLAESESRGEDNLIIGDAKQSIYRFRNADPSLITEAVPQAFPRHTEAGLSRADNTNWRSDRTIVEFNNFFFHNLVADILSQASLGTIDFTDLYGNVAQYASHRDRKGYVEIRFLDPASLPEETDGDTGGREKLPKEERLRAEALCQTGLLVEELLMRGYRQRDIALLVDTNDLGKEVIAALVDYNTSLPPGARRIEFISEESLLVSSAEAVGIIVSVLSKMVEGSDIRRRRSQDKKDDGEDGDICRADWADIKCNFSFYALRHPEMTPAEQVRGFLDGDSPADAIGAMLSGMQTVALPALVEAITENFVPEGLRKDQAVFISAFQDMVLEYTERYAADIASFLYWWKTKGTARSISSPEGTDAVQIMTVHKSKGLEFRCVILPFSDSSFVPSQRKKEWRWVEPAECMAGRGLPPVLPVETTSALVGTAHEKEWIRYHDLHMMDRLNSAYVAFTRAVSELYIFTSLPEKRGSMKLGGLLHTVCTDATMRLDMTPDAIADLMPPPELTRYDETEGILTFGARPQVPTNADATPTPEAQEGDDTGSTRHRVITEYGVDGSASVLRYVEGDDDKGETLMPDASDTDPRSEGNLLHAVMERVRTADDLPRAITTMKMKGLITAAQAQEWSDMLARAISSEPVGGWFHPSWRVMNERTIFSRRGKDPRPDRIMLSPDRRKAVIVDYKFGAVPNDDSHLRQVRGYIDALKEATGIHDVSGFIWYVRLGRIMTAG